MTVLRNSTPVYNFLRTIAGKRRRGDNSTIIFMLRITWSMVQATWLVFECFNVLDVFAVGDVLVIRAAWFHIAFVNRTRCGQLSTSRKLDPTMVMDTWWGRETNLDFKHKFAMCLRQFSTPSRQFTRLSRQFAAMSQQFTFCLHQFWYSFTVPSGAFETILIV